jgi:hypothetical protein
MDEELVKKFVTLVIEKSGELIDEHREIRFPEWVRMLAASNSDLPVAVMEEMVHEDDVNKVMESRKGVMDEKAFENI